MVIPKGYKQTEVDVIPEDWECKRIGNIAQVKMCKRIFAEQTAETGEIPFYKIGTFGKNPDAYITRALYEEYKAKYSYPEEGDVLISAAGTLGRTVVFDGKDAYFQDSNIVWLDVDHGVLSNRYLRHYYTVIKWASSEGSTISRLYNGIICDTYIAIPPIEEQAKIVIALSDIDELIYSLEKLITKYEAIKQSCLQNMFPSDGKAEPKMRLPGFTGAWEQRKVGELTSILSAARVHKDEWTTDGVPFFRSSDVVSAYKGAENTKAFIPFALYDELVKSSGRLEKGDILITGGGSIGIPYIVPNNEPLYSKDADLIWIKNHLHLTASSYLHILLAPFSEDT